MILSTEKFRRGNVSPNSVSFLFGSDSFFFPALHFFLPALREHQQRLVISEVDAGVVFMLWYQAKLFDFDAVGPPAHA